MVRRPTARSHPPWSGDLKPGRAPQRLHAVSLVDGIFGATRRSWAPSSQLPRRPATTSSSPNASETLDTTRYEPIAGLGKIDAAPVLCVIVSAGQFAYGDKKAKERLDAKTAFDGYLHPLRAAAEGSGDNKDLSENLDSEEKASPVAPQSVLDEKEAEQFADEDKVVKERVDAQTAFDGYLHSMRSAVRLSGPPLVLRQRRPGQQRRAGHAGDCADRGRREASSRTSLPKQVHRDCGLSPP